MMGPLPFGTRYLGVNSCSTSTPSWLRGRSFTCPIEAMTSYRPSRSFLSVLALVGDSTTTSDLANPVPPLPLLPLLPLNKRHRRRILYPNLRYCQIRGVWDLYSIAYRPPGTRRTMPRSSSDTSAAAAAATPIPAEDARLSTDLASPAARPASSVCSDGVRPAAAAPR